jgi:hypothetical protein
MKVATAASARLLGAFGISTDGPEEKAQIAHVVPETNSPQSITTTYS